MPIKSEIEDYLKERARAKVDKTLRDQIVAHLLQFHREPQQITYNERVFRSLPPEVKQEAVDQALVQQQRNIATEAQSIIDILNMMASAGQGEGGGMYTSFAIPKQPSVPGTFRQQEEIGERGREWTEYGETFKDLGKSEEYFREGLERIRTPADALIFLRMLEGEKPAPPEAKKFPWGHLIGAGISMLAGGLVGKSMGIPGIALGMPAATGYLSGAYQAYLAQEAAKRAAYEAELEYATRMANAKMYGLQTLYPYMALEPKAYFEQAETAARYAPEIRRKYGTVTEHTRRTIAETRPAMERYLRGLIGLGYSRLAAQERRDLWSHYVKLIDKSSSVVVGAYKDPKAFHESMNELLNAQTAIGHNIPEVAGYKQGDFLLTIPTAQGIFLTPGEKLGQHGEVAVAKQRGVGKDKKVSLYLLTAEDIETLKGMYGSGQLTGDFARDKETLTQSKYRELPNIVEEATTNPEDYQALQRTYTEMMNTIREYEPGPTNLERMKEYMELLGLPGPSETGETKTTE
ncbi:MAG: hypothetical protein ABIN54_09110 [candidate division WOR-3 bacterium]